MSNDSTVIALDPGFGNTKVAFDGHVAVMQTAVSRPRNIGLAAVGMKSAGRSVPIVQFSGHTFAVGPQSWTRGAPLTSMDYSSLVAPERLALFYAALAEAYALSEKARKSTPVGLPMNGTLVVGLPVPLLEDENLAATVRDSLRQLKRVHTFTIDRQDYSVGITTIKVLAQPVGGWMDWLYGDDLKLRDSASPKIEAAVIDLGMNTLDIYVIQNGQVIDTFVGGAEVGVRRLIELMQTNGHDLVELDAQLRNGTITPSSEQLDAWLSEVNAAIKRTLPSLKRFGIVIPVGGGASILGDRLRRALTSRGAVVYTHPEPVTANVRGLWKFGGRANK